MNASWSTDVTTTVLPNGLTLLVERNTSAPVVSVVSHVRAGYFDEPDEWVGISHVLEHMFFKGSKRFSAGALARETQKLGGYLNAGTIYDKTVYYTVLPSTPEVVDRALELQMDALTALSLDPSELERELEVIIQEANRKLDSPSAVTTETLYSILFAQHRIRRWRIGTEERLRTLTVDDVAEYYATRYTPGRTIVAIVGDLDAERVLETASRLYAEWRRPEWAIAGSPVERVPPAPTVRVLEGDVKRGLGTVGWRTVDVHHADVHALDLAAAVLGSGRGSWLSREVRTPGLATSVSAQHYTPTEVGVFDIFVEGDVQRLDDAMARSVELVNGLNVREVSGDDLDRAKTLLATRWARRMESMDGRAALFCEFEALGGVHLIDSWYEQLMEVSPTQLHAAVSRHLACDVSSSVVYLPRGKRTSLATREWPASGHRVVEPAPVTLVDVPDGHLKQPSFVTRYEGEIRHLALDGVDLLVRPKLGSGLLFIGAYALGLRDLERPETGGLSTLYVRSALRGASGMTAEELAEVAERLGGTIVPTVVSGAVGWGLMVHADPGAGARAASLLRAIAFNPALSGEHIELERSLLETDAARAKDDMYRYPLRRVLEVGLPHSVYSIPTLGEPERVRELTDNLVRSWADRFRARRLTVVAVGDLPYDALVDVLVPFGDWQGRERSDSQDQVSWNAARVSEAREKAQTALAMAFPAGPHGSTDRFPMIVAGSLLSGLAGRLFDALREKRSLAYTVVASPWVRRSVGAMLTYIATSPDREEEARDQMLRELERLAVEPILEDEIERARNYAIGAIQLRLQSSFAVAGEILEAWIHGDLAGLADTSTRLQSVTKGDLRELAGRVFDSKRRAEFVLRGEGKAS